MVMRPLQVMVALKGERAIRIGVNDSKENSVRLAHLPRYHVTDRAPGGPAPPYADNPPREEFYYWG
jgi:hypothetical protein